MADAKTRGDTPPTKPIYEIRDGCLFERDSKSKTKIASAVSKTSLYWEENPCVNDLKWRVENIMSKALQGDLDVDGEKPGEVAPGTVG